MHTLGACRDSVCRGPEGMLVASFPLVLSASALLSFLLSDEAGSAPRRRGFAAPLRRIGPAQPIHGEHASGGGRGRSSPADVRHPGGGRGGRAAFPLQWLPPDGRSMDALRSAWRRPWRLHGPCSDGDAHQPVIPGAERSATPAGTGRMLRVGVVASTVRPAAVRIHPDRVRFLRPVGASDAPAC